MHAQGGLGGPAAVAGGVQVGGFPVRPAVGGAGCIKEPRIAFTGIGRGGDGCTRALAGVRSMT